MSVQLKAKKKQNFNHLSVFSLHFLKFPDPPDSCFTTLLMVRATLQPTLQSLIDELMTTNTDVILLITTAYSTLSTVYPLFT